MVPIYAALVVAVASMFYGFFTFDRVVRLEHERHHGEWVADGEPVGFFWRPPGASVVRGGFAMERLSLLWLFWTPGWAKGSEDAGHLLHHMRVAVFGSYALFIAALVTSTSHL